MNTKFFQRLTAFFLAVLTPLVSLVRYGGIVNKSRFNGGDYSITRIDLSVKPEGLDERFDYLYDLVTLDDSLDYAAHPDSVLLKNGNILTMYPAGHGKGAVLTKLSTDGGKSWSQAAELVPGDVSGGRGPVKNKPLLLPTGRILAPASTEQGRWLCFADICKKMQA